MTKQSFLDQLRSGLSPLPKEAREEYLSFYTEMLDDRMEEGMEEEQAVQELGTVEEILSRIYTEVPLSALVKEKITPKRRLKPLEIVFLILGSPIWLSLLLAALAVLLSLAVCIWSIVISVWSVFAATVACSFAFLASGVIFVLQGHSLTGLAVIGGSLILAGFSVFLFLGCKSVSKGAVLLCKQGFQALKKPFFGKEAAQ